MTSEIRCVAPAGALKEDGGDWSPSTLLVLLSQFHMPGAAQFFFPPVGKCRETRPWVRRYELETPICEPLFCGMICPERCDLHYQHERERIARTSALVLDLFQPSGPTGGGR